MAITLLDYKTAVYNKGFDSVTQGTVVADAVNAARAELLNERRWGFLETLGNATLTTTVGQSTVATATITDLLYIDAVRMQLNNQGYTLTPLALQEFRRLENLDRTNGAPTWWTAAAGAGPATIRLGPRPDQVYTLLVDYVKSTIDLANDATAEPTLPANFKTAVVWKACEHLAFRLRQPDTQQLANRNYGLELAKLVRQEGMGQRQESQQVAESGYWDYGDNVGGWSY